MRPTAPPERRQRRLRIDEAVCVATTMPVEMTSGDPAQRTEVERAREERARAVRTRQDRAKTPQERLEETLRLSKLVSELQQGAAGDVPSR
jgi:hypothetical protein